MTAFAAGRGMECRLLSLNDTPELHRLAVGTREFVFTGSDRGKTRFSVTAARRRAKLVLAAHPHLAPVARGLKLFAPRAKSIICTHGLEVWEPLSILRRSGERKPDLGLSPTHEPRNNAGRPRATLDIA